MSDKEYREWLVNELVEAGQGTKEELEKKYYKSHFRVIERDYNIYIDTKYAG